MSSMAAGGCCGKFVNAFTQLNTTRLFPEVTGKTITSWRHVELFLNVLTGFDNNVPAIGVTDDSVMYTAK